MNTGKKGPWFKREIRKDALLFRDKKILILKSASRMNPWAIIEGIPAKAKTIDIFVYHAYLNGFHMDNKCNIKFSKRTEKH